MASESLEWLPKALGMFPELQGELFLHHNQDSPSALWIDLFSLLHFAYTEDPQNDDLIGRIYSYAAWCFEQPDTENAETDLSSATAIGLIETIPLDQKISDDLYRWMTVEAFDGFESLFRYHLADEAFCAFRAEFVRKKKSYSGPSILF